MCFYSMCFVYVIHHFGHYHASGRAPLLYIVVGVWYYATCFIVVSLYDKSSVYSGNLCLSIWHSRLNTILFS